MVITCFNGARRLGTVKRCYGGGPHPGLAAKDLTVIGRPVGGGLLLYRRGGRSAVVHRAGKLFRSIRASGDLPLRGGGKKGGVVFESKARAVKAAWCRRQCE